MRKEDIIRALKEERCVLVLGPELCNMHSDVFTKDKTVVDFDEFINLAYHYYFDKVVEEDDKEWLTKHKINFVTYPFAKEHLLSINNTEPYAGEHLKDFAEWFFEENQCWDEPFQKIANIPFPLILSMLPNDKLEKSFEKILGKDSYNVRKFSRVINPNSIDEQSIEPSKNKPLIYKLLGDIKDYDAVFTFDDWFEYFIRIFGSNTLPLDITTFLNKRPIFIFLGVRFEKWYIQLLVRFLVSKDKTRIINHGKKFAFSHVKNEGVKDLTEERLKLIFDESQPTRVLQELYQACSEENILRKPNIQLSVHQRVVFISYSSHDFKKANQIKHSLESNGIKVIIDTEDNIIGKDINIFINQSISSANFIVQLISKNFLVSDWVADESKKAFVAAELMGKIILPCDIDNVLRVDEFRNEAMSKINYKISEIGNQIRERLTESSSTSIIDLSNRRERMIKLKNSYDEVIDKFTNIKTRGDLRDENYDTGITKLIKDIKNHSFFTT